MSKNPVTAGIARLTDQDEVEVARLLGGGWTKAELVFHTAREPELDPRELFVLGQPLQLVAVRSPSRSDWAIGAARVEWATQVPVLTMTGEVLIGPGDDLIAKAAEVRRLLTARRRSFRYCGLCAEQMAPEHQFEKDVCQGCASEWLGVVF